MEPAASSEGTCAKCGSRHLLRELPLFAGGGRLFCQAGVEKLGFLTLSTVSAEVTAVVCVDCGNTEFRVEDTSELRRIYDQKR